MVDSLTGGYPQKAIAALTRFMKALGSFHAASFGNTALYEQLLRSIHPELATVEEESHFLCHDLLSKLISANKKLGLTVSNECIEEVRSLIDYLLQPGSFTVLTHGDICPDNVFDHEDTKDLQLIDFEWCCIRNALLDGTYLRMSMPTCWCAKAIPTSLIESLEQIYREELQRTIPAAADDLEYNKAYIYACGFWVLQQAIPFIDSVWEKDRIGPSDTVPQDSLWNPDENWVRPRVLSRLQAFIDIASDHQHLPHLKKIVVAMLAELIKCWKDVPFLEVYPAFLSKGESSC